MFPRRPGTLAHGIRLDDPFGEQQHVVETAPYQLEMEVVDDTGEPIEGALWRMRHWDFGFPGVERTTGPDGRASYFCGDDLLEFELWTPDGRRWHQFGFPDGDIALRIAVGPDHITVVSSSGVQW